MDDDGVSMVSQYTIATASHAGTRHGGRYTPAAMHPAAPQREAHEHRAIRRHGLRTVLCLALTAAAAYLVRVRWPCAPLVDTHRYGCSAMATCSNSLSGLGDDLSDTLCFC